MPKTAILSLRKIHPYPWMTTSWAYESLFEKAYGADVYSVVPIPGRITRFVSDHGNLRRLMRAAGSPSMKVEPAPPRTAAYDFLSVFGMGPRDDTELFEGLKHFPRLATTQILVQAEIWRSDLESRTSTDPRDSSLTISTSCTASSTLSVPGARCCAQGAGALPRTRGGHYSLREWPGPRPIAVTSLGRRDLRQHATLKEWSRKDASLVCLRHSQTGQGNLIP